MGERREMGMPDAKRKVTEKPWGRILATRPRGKGAHAGWMDDQRCESSVAARSNCSSFISEELKDSLET